jgi:hypothetical protein
MRRVLALAVLLAPGLAAAQDLAVLDPPRAPAVVAQGQARADEAFADHEARAHRLMAAICLGCGTADENADAPALAIPDLPPSDAP